MADITADKILDILLLLHRAEFDDECVLAEGEPGYHTSTKELKIGDGTTAWKDLPFANETLIKAILANELEKALEGVITTSNLADNLPKYDGSYV